MILLLLTSFDLANAIVAHPSCSFSYAVIHSANTVDCLLCGWCSSRVYRSEPSRQGAWFPIGATPDLLGSIFCFEVLDSSGRVWGCVCVSIPPCTGSLHQMCWGVGVMCWGVGVRYRKKVGLRLETYVTLMFFFYLRCIKFSCLYLKRVDPFFKYRFSVLGVLNSTGWKLYLQCAAPDFHLLAMQAEWAHIYCQVIWAQNYTFLVIFFFPPNLLQLFCLYLAWRQLFFNKIVSVSLFKTFGLISKNHFFFFFLSSRVSVYLLFGH